MYHWNPASGVSVLEKAKRRMTHLDVAPPVTAILTRALREVNFLARELAREVRLIRESAGITMEGDPSERALSLLHLPDQTRRRC